MKSSNISPYVRAGGKYNMASGEYVESSSIGFFGGVGIEFSRTSKPSWGLEVAYDTSEIELKKYKTTSSFNKEKVKPGDLLVSVFMIF